MTQSAQSLGIKQNKERLGHRFQKPSLSKDYFTFAVVITIAVILLAVGFSIVIYASQQKQKKSRLINDASRAERVIIESFDYTERLSVLLGKQVVEHGVASPEFIANLFRQTSLPDLDRRNSFSWSLFDWVDSDNMQTVNTRHGVAKKPKNMSVRSYTVKSPKNPWKLQVSKPAIGYPSGQWVIPVAVGVTGKDKSYLGAIVTGINIGKLTSKIEQVLQEEASFAVIGEDMGGDFEVILHSQGVMSSPEQKADLIKQFLEAKKHTNKNGVFDQEIVFGNTAFLVYQKVRQYPYYVLMGYRKDAAMQDFLSILLPRIMEFTGMGLFCFVLLLFFRRKIITPIAKLSNAADKISHGDSHVVIPRCGSYELDNLAFQLEQVVRYIEELQRIRTELIKKTEAAESANRAKSEFLACMSHELRTPLNAVIAFSEILKEEMFGRLGNEKYQEYAYDIYNSGTHLLGIINDILDISKAEAGLIVLQKHPVDVEKVVRECLTIVSERANKGKISLEMNVENTLPRLISDELRLKQIIINLLSNAIKFTPEGGKVSITAKVETQGEKVTDYYIVIKDTGIGMKEADIPKAVEKFGQLDTGLNRKFEGAGLGLPLTKKLVEIHHGNLSIESTLNVGTKVTIHFPQSNTALKNQEGTLLL